MRPISGLDRPLIQWIFALCGIALIAACAATGVALVRMRRSVEEARRDAMQARIDREQVEASLARERSTREAVMLQLGKERSAAAPASTPTLTLSPVLKKSPRGPEIAVPQTSAPVVDLRLLLPKGAPAGPFTVTARSWNTGEIEWVRAALPAGAADKKPAVVLAITSDVLVPGQHEFVLTAGSPPVNVTTYEVAVTPSAAPSADRR